MNDFLNEVVINVNVHGSLSDDENENDIKYSNNKPRVCTKNKRGLKTSFKKNIKPAKRFKKSLNGSTTTDEDQISLYSESDDLINSTLSDISNFELDEPIFTDYSKDLQIKSTLQKSRVECEKFYNDPEI